MFIIICDEDNSYCEVPDENVIFDDKNPPKKGEHVHFFWNGTRYTGEVVIKSDDIEILNKVYQELIKNKRMPKELPLKDNNSLIITTKRQPKKKREFSSTPCGNIKTEMMQKNKRMKSDNEATDSRKKGDEASQLFIETIIASDKKLKNPTKVSSSSPSKEELKKMLEEAYKKIESSKKSNAGHSQPATAEPLKLSSSSTSQGRKVQKPIKEKDDSTTTESECDDKENILESSFSESDNGNEIINFKKLIRDETKKHGNEKKTEDKVETMNDGRKDKRTDADYAEVEKPDDGVDDLLADASDLFGKDWPGEKMVKLIDKVYCKGSELAPALALSNQATHLARRLIVGVFKPSGYLNATFTGQASRAHKNKHKSENPVKSLNEVAKNEILDYAMERAKKRDG
ncbi:hypothetical protein ACS0PU_004529 [Formica fusca]